MILFEKFGQHQPLNPQSERYAREGIDLSLSTLADQVGACAAILKPLHRLVLSAERLHGNNTTVPILAKGKTDTGGIWTYVRDDRPFGERRRRPPSTMPREIAGRNIPSVGLKNVTILQTVSHKASTERSALTRRSGLRRRASASRAVAITGPMPGIVISRLATSSRRALWRFPGPALAPCRAESATEKSMPDRGACFLRQRAVLIFDNSNQGADMRRPLWSDESKFRQVASQGVESFDEPADRGLCISRILLRSSLHRNEPHYWSERRFTDRFRVSRVILLPFDERLKIYRGDQFDLVPELRNLSALMMAAGASLHGNRARLDRC